MEKIFIVIALQSIYASDFGNKHLTDNDYISIPYPIVEGSTQYILFTFFPRDAARPDSKQRIYLPKYEVKVKYPNKEMTVKELKTNIYQFTLSGEYNSIGNVKILENHDIKTVLNAKKEYEKLLSLVLEKGYLVTQSSALEQKEMAKKIKQDLNVLQEKDLGKYDKRNQDCLFEWMNRVLK